MNAATLPLGSVFLWRITSLPNVKKGIPACVPRATVQTYCVASRRAAARGTRHPVAPLKVGLETSSACHLFGFSDNVPQMQFSAKTHHLGVPSRLS